MPRSSAAVVWAFRPAAFGDFGSKRHHFAHKTVFCYTVRCFSYRQASCGHAKTNPLKIHLVLASNTPFSLYIRSARMCVYVCIVIKHRTPVMDQHYFYRTVPVSVGTV